MTDQIKVQSTFIVYTFPYKNNNCTLAIKKTNTSLSLNGLTYAWLILIFLLVENSLCEKKKLNSRANNWQIKIHPFSSQIYSMLIKY